MPTFYNINNEPSTESTTGGVDLHCNKIIPEGIIEQVITRQAERDTMINDAIDNDLGINARIQNLDWETYCDKFDTINYIIKRNDDVSIPFCNNQMIINNPLPSQAILSEWSSFRGSSSSFDRLVISSNNHILPYLEGATETCIISNTDKGINNKGFIFNMRSDKCGLLCFVPFLESKKIYGFYIMQSHGSRTEMQFFNIGKCKYDESLYNMIAPTINEARSLSDNLTDEDKVRIANSSSKSKKLVNNWGRVDTAISYFNYMLFETLDLGYFYKLMELNKIISFG